MLTADEITAMRAVTAQVLPDTATVTRTTGSTFDPNTGTDTPTTSVVYGPAAARLAMPSLQEREALFGGEQISMSRFVVTFPHDTDDLALEDVITFSVSGDGLAEARSFRIVVIGLKSYNLNRTVGCEVVE